MNLHYRHGISILELIVYCPTLILAVWMAFRHGIKKSAEWYFFMMFSLARIIGATCYLATIHDPSDAGLYIAWAVCTSLGLSPLILACVGLISRANNSIMRNAGRPLRPIMFRLVALISLVALILSIVGFTENADITQGLLNTKTQVGFVLFLVTWVGACGLFLLVTSRSHSIEDGEHRLLLAVGISLPLVLVRLIYSFIYIFGHRQAFNMLSGNVTIQLVMSVLEEIIIVLVCLGVGLTLPVRPNADSNDQPALLGAQGSSVDLEGSSPLSQTSRQRRYQHRKRGVALFRNFSWLSGTKSIARDND